jgi:hypothetical protein
MRRGADSPRRAASPRDQFGSAGPALSYWNSDKNRREPLTICRL